MKMSSLQQLLLATKWRSAKERRATDNYTCRRYVTAGQYQGRLKGRGRYAQCLIVNSWVGVVRMNGVQVESKLTSS